MMLHHASLLRTHVACFFPLRCFRPCLASVARIIDAEFEQQYEADNDNRQRAEAEGAEEPGAGHAAGASSAGPDTRLGDGAGARSLVPVPKSLVRKPRPLADLFGWTLLLSTASATRPGACGSIMITCTQKLGQN